LSSTKTTATRKQRVVESPAFTRKWKLIFYWHWIFATRCLRVISAACGKPLLMRLVILLNDRTSPRACI